MVVRQFDIWWVALNPTVGAEIQKNRPCIVVSPDDMNRFMATVILAPMTTKGPRFQSRVPCYFAGKNGHVALDQIRAVDKSRLGRRMGRLDDETQDAVLDVLSSMFAKKEQ